MPSSSLPGAGRSRPTVAPPARTTASYSPRSCSADRSPSPLPPTSTPVTNRVPSARPRPPGANPGPSGPLWAPPRVRGALLHFDLGDPVPEHPADPVGPLVDGHIV